MDTTIEYDRGPSVVKSTHAVGGFSTLDLGCSIALFEPRSEVDCFIPLRYTKHSTSDPYHSTQSKNKK